MQVHAWSLGGSGQREFLPAVVTVLASGPFRWGVCVSSAARSWPTPTACLLRTASTFPVPGIRGTGRALPSSDSLALFFTLAGKESSPHVRPDILKTRTPPLCCGEGGRCWSPESITGNPANKSLQTTLEAISPPHSSMG